MRNLLLIIGLFSVSSAMAAGDAAGGTPFFEISSPLVVNIIDDKNKSMNFLQVNAQLKTSRPDLKQQLHLHMPAIQHTMMLLLSEQKLEDLKSVQGKAALRVKAVQELQALLTEQIGDPVVEEIYFTAFVIQ